MSQFDGDVPLGSYSLYSELPESEDTDATFSEKLDTYYYDDHDDQIISSSNRRDTYSSKRDSHRVSNYNKRNSSRLSSVNRSSRQKENGGYHYPAANGSRTTTASPKPANGDDDTPLVSPLPDENQGGSANVQIIKAIGTEYEPESGSSFGWPSGRDGEGKVILSTGSLIDINGKNKPAGNPNSELEDDVEGPYPVRVNGNSNGKTNGNGKGGSNGHSSGGPYPARMSSKPNGNGNTNGHDSAPPQPSRSNGNGHDSAAPYPPRANGNVKGNGQDSGGPYPARLNGKPNNNGPAKLEKATYLPPSRNDDESVDGNFGERVEKPSNGVAKSDKIISLVPESTNDNHNRNSIRQILFNKSNSPPFETNAKSSNNANPGVSDIVLQSHFFGTASDVVSSISIPFNYDDSDKPVATKSAKDSSGSFGVQNASPFVHHSHRHSYTDTDEDRNADDEIPSSISNAIYSFTSD